MPRTKWRTVSCTDDSLRSHTSQQSAYAWIAGREQGAWFRVQYDERLGGGWRAYATVTAAGDGKTEEQ